jgi:chemotaxis response regulator CheB
MSKTPKPARKPGSKQAPKTHTPQDTSRRKAVRQSNTLKNTAKQIALAAKELYHKVYGLDLQADDLHHSAEEVHIASCALNAPAGKQGSEAASAPVVREDRPGPNIKPFPIVGIGTAEGGDEAVSELLANVSSRAAVAFVLAHRLNNEEVICARSMVWTCEPFLLLKTTRMTFSF